jgi:hypothetical protein
MIRSRNWRKMMIIQFPKQRQKSLSPSAQPSSEKPLGLYFLLCFILLYLTAVLWVQRDLPTSGSPASATPSGQVGMPKTKSLNSHVQISSINESESFRAVQ